MSKELINGISSKRRVLPIVWRGTRWGLPFFLLVAGGRLGWALLRRRAGLVHLGDPVLAPLAWLAFAARVPVLVTVHGLDFVYANRAYQYLLSLTLRRCAGLICISSHVRALVLAKGLAADRVFVVTLGVAPSIPPADEADVDMRSLGVKPDAKVILTIGRLVPRKGFAWFLAEVFAPMAQHRKDLHLVIIGSGPERARLASLCLEGDLKLRVHLLGSVSEPVKWRWLQRAMVLAIPNLPVENDVEGFGIVALEGAMAARTVLAARLEGLVDAVRDGETGWLLPPGDAGAWTARLESCLNDEVSHTEMGLVARREVVARFGWARVVDEYCSIFDAHSLVSQ